MLLNDEDALRRQQDSIHDSTAEDSSSSDSDSTRLSLSSYPKTLEPLSTDLCNLTSVFFNITVADYCSFRLPPCIPPSFRGTSIRL